MAKWSRPPKAPGQQVVPADEVEEGRVHARDGGGERGVPEVANDAFRTSSYAEQDAAFGEHVLTQWEPQRTLQVRRRLHHLGGDHARDESVHDAHIHARHVPPERTGHASVISGSAPSALTVIREALADA